MNKISKLLIKIATPIVLTTSCVVPLTSCSQNKTEEVGLTVDVEQETNFHHVKLGCTTADIQAKGIDFGDSVDISCTNGFKLTNIPFMTGYYVKHGEWVICSYNGGKQPLLAQSCRDGWLNSNLQKGNKLTITLNKKGGFKEVQENLNLKPIKEQGTMSDEAFANFRDPGEQAGNTLLVSKKIYRGFSPLYNSDSYNNRRYTVNKLCNGNVVDFDIDLADDEERIQSHFKSADMDKIYWFKNTYDAGRVLAVKMTTDFQNKTVRAQIQTVMIRIIDALDNGQRVYIHCDEGKDRTGFILMLLEGLVGWSEQEIIDDYMTTYKNFYNVDKSSTQYKYIKDILYQGSMDEILAWAKEGEANPIQSGCYNFLISCGMLHYEVKHLKDLLTNK